MGRASKKRGRALKRAKKALQAIVGITGIYYNDSLLVSICEKAKEGLIKSN